MYLHHCPGKRKNWVSARLFVFYRITQLVKGEAQVIAFWSPNSNKMFFFFRWKNVFLQSWKVLKLINICRDWKNIICIHITQKTLDIDYLQKYFFLSVLSLHVKNIYISSIVLGSCFLFSVGSLKWSSIVICHWNLVWKNNMSVSLNFFTLFFFTFWPGSEIFFFVPEIQ